MHEFPPEVEKRVRAEAKRFKEPLPQRIVNKPSLFLGSAVFLNAWFELDAERQRPKPITRSACFSYGRDYEFDRELTEELWQHIRHMDIAFLEWWKKKQPKPKAPRGKGQRGQDA